MTQILAHKAKTTFSKETYLDWFETMLRIRRFEERALMMYSQRKIRGFCHVYIGQEAVAAGMESALQEGDCIVTAYRQHGTAQMVFAWALCVGLIAKFAESLIFSSVSYRPLPAR